MSASSLHRAHDRLFRHVFSKPEHARGQLMRMVPTELRDALDWSSLRRVPGMHVEEALKENYSDLVFDVCTKCTDPRPMLFYLLFEHQTKDDDWMPFRLLN
ncbi:MAG: Rpn family recombination-promoting nuclease/putative transposase [Myxococcota bacterium]